jgi:hypothetical protein
MYGDEKVRFCRECKLNVYNLSGMSRTEAERLLMNSEGRLCVRFFRRGDGTVLTQDCPVGWRAIKKRASRSIVAFASLIIGFFGGILSLRAPDAFVEALPMGSVPAPDYDGRELPVEVGQAIYFDAPDVPKGETDYLPVLGRIEVIEPLANQKVEVWIK